MQNAGATRAGGHRLRSGPRSADCRPGWIDGLLATPAGRYAVRGLGTTKIAHVMWFESEGADGAAPRRAEARIAAWRPAACPRRAEADAADA